MKTIIQFVLSAIVGIACTSPAFAAESTPAQPVAQIVVTAHAQQQKGTPPTLDRSDVILFQGKQRAVVTDLVPLKADQSKTQLFIYIDDSLRASALGTQIPALKEFVQQLPSSTEVAIGYMRNGGFALVQAFTTDHATAAGSIRLPVSSPGLKGVPILHSRISPSTGLQRNKLTGESS